MILNAYAILDAFLACLRLGLALLVVGYALVALRRWLRCGGAGRHEEQEQGGHLLIALATVLLVLNVAAWPLFYLVLQSYVPEWPGVMCIYGVTQIGVGSLGSSRWLPALLVLLQVLKPALIFVSGAWFVLHLVNRATRTGPLYGRLVVVLGLAALVAAVDAGVELAYLAIPKREVFVSPGCCTEIDLTARYVPAAILAGPTTPWLYGAFYAVHGGLIVALAAFHFRLLSLRPGSLLALLMGTVVALGVSAVFLVDVAAPRLLRLPYHHCPYDLLPRVPESVVTIALFALAGLAVGWANVVAWLGGHSEATLTAPTLTARLIHLALIASLAALMMMTMELWLA